VAKLADFGEAAEFNTEAGRCRLTPGCPLVGRAWLQRFRLKYDHPVSNFAIDFNLRRYTEDSRQTYCGTRWYRAPEQFLGSAAGGAHYRLGSEVHQGRAVLVDNSRNRC
jgi:serine/threonine protein kinase